METHLLTQYVEIHNTILITAATTKQGKTMNGIELTAVVAAIEARMAYEYTSDEFGEDAIEAEVLSVLETSTEDWAVTVLNAQSKLSRIDALIAIAKIDDECGYQLEERFHWDWERELARFLNLHSGGAK